MDHADAHIEKLVAFYTEREDEDARLDAPIGRLEFARLTTILAEHLPASSTILDVGGGTGRIAAWLTDQGHHVRLIDPVPSHVEQARARGIDAELGDARRLAAQDASQDAVLLFGPLYHLPEREDRLAALREAARVLRPGGLLFGIVINRFAGALDSIRGGYVDTGFGEIGYFHRPDELPAEIAEAPLVLDRLLSLEGPGWLLDSLGERWQDPETRERILDVARLVEAEPSLLGLSPHLLAIAHR